MLPQRGPRRAENGPFGLQILQETPKEASRGSKEALKRVRKEPKRPRGLHRGPTITPMEPRTPQERGERDSKRFRAGSAKKNALRAYRAGTQPFTAKEIPCAIVHDCTVQSPAIAYNQLKSKPTAIPRLIRHTRQLLCVHVCGGRDTEHADGVLGELAFRFNIPTQESSKVDAEKL